MRPVQKVSAGCRRRADELWAEAVEQAETRQADGGSEGAKWAALPTGGQAAAPAPSAPPQRIEGSGVKGRVSGQEGAQQEPEPPQPPAAKARAAAGKVCLAPAAKRLPAAWKAQPRGDGRGSSQQSQLRTPPRGSNSPI